MHRLWIAAMLIAVTAILQMRLAPVRGQPDPDLSAYDCTDVTQSQLLKRLCYDEARRTMVAQVAGRYYAHCNIDASVLDRLSEAESVPTYYLTEIRAGHKCRAGELTPEIAKVIAQ